jgi:hypothetical protein
MPDNVVTTHTPNFATFDVKEGPEQVGFTYEYGQLHTFIGDSPVNI